MFKPFLVASYWFNKKQETSNQKQETSNQKQETSNNRLMATIKRFEDLEIWQLARELNIKISQILEKLEAARNYDLKSQLDRSAGYPACPK